MGGHPFGERLGPRRNLPVGSCSSRITGVFYAVAIGLQACLSDSLRSITLSSAGLCAPYSFFADLYGDKYHGGPVGRDDEHVPPDLSIGTGIARAIISLGFTAFPCLRSVLSRSQGSRSPSTKAARSPTTQAALPRWPSSDRACGA